MKILISLCLLMFAIGAAVAQTNFKPAHESSPATIEIQNLEQKLDNLTYYPATRNGKLRIQRAHYYLKSSKKLHQSNWQQQALDHAKRGLNLVDLHLSSVQQTVPRAAL
ncbi:hypothetical protein [Aliiglaciecola sp. LCG003]|uniref:hypothetical protein n=1 Tax=Aliiglaciecola sp. LCG003 TaxID=3053655 RepID=UPI0025736996|nr:hypothetical protein [Aliiglaciecola sp. LCG003]WJG11026.1 hypothetical protein QR722_08375 [Aliiglaciecola sp. LCG003]